MLGFFIPWIVKLLIESNAHDAPHEISPEAREYLRDKAIEESLEQYRDREKSYDLLP